VISARAKAAGPALLTHDLGVALPEDFWHNGPSSRSLSKTLMETYQIKVTLLDTCPPIWRRVLVPSDITLRTLHRTVQTAMGWTDSHVHQFIFKGQKYSDPKYQLGVGTTDERKTRLCEVSSTVGNRFLYEYDFGDDWRHELRLEQVLVQNDSFRPICVAGERACPPEDCGGSLGYAELLEIVANPDHPEYDDRLEWLNGNFDPECFDLAEVNRKLMQSKR
jgi:Plasmid pRiA4b ORF-3-like protein